MNRILTFIFLFFVFLSYGQFSHSPEPMEISTPIDNKDHEFTLTINIDKDTSYNIYWEVYKDLDTWQEGWATQICDLHLCYVDNFDKSPNSKPNIMRKGSYEFFIHFKPYGIEGCSSFQLALFADEERTIEVDRVNMIIKNCAVSTDDVINKNQIKVYPNPASDFFSLTNSSQVNKVTLYNMFGAEIKSFYHYNNAQHQIGELKPGMYLLRMFDKDNNTIKTVKLNKTYSGA